LFDKLLRALTSFDLNSIFSAQYGVANAPKTSS